MDVCYKYCHSFLVFTHLDQTSWHKLFAVDKNHPSIFFYASVRKACWPILGRLTMEGHFSADLCFVDLYPPPPPPLPDIHWQPLISYKIYETIIRPALTYGSECWAMKVTNKRKIATTEMRMLRGILGVSRRDHMRNEEIRRILHLSPIDEVMRSGRLRWFGHVQRRDATNVTRRVMELAIPGTRRRGRPKKTWHQQMKEDMAGVGVTQDVALDRKEWRRRTRPTPTR